MNTVSFGLIGVVILLMVGALAHATIIRRRVLGTADKDAREVEVEIYKAEVQLLGAAGLFLSVSLGVVSFSQQAQQYLAQQNAEKERLSSDQFQIAIGLFEKTELSSTEWARPHSRRLQRGRQRCSPWALCR